MISDFSRSKESFISKLSYVGVAITGTSHHHGYLDLEQFFLQATNELTSSRIAEGYLCWIIEYGHVLSPSKTRNLIKQGVSFNSHILGGIIGLMAGYRISDRQWRILKMFCKKSKNELSFSGLNHKPRVRDPNPHFLDYNVIFPNFKLDKEKFLRRKDWVLKNCVELRNRALFGSVVHSDIASYLHYFPDATPYQISKATGNHKARIFKSFSDVRDSLHAA